VKTILVTFSFLITNILVAQNNQYSSNSDDPGSAGSKQRPVKKTYPEKPVPSQSGVVTPIVQTITSSEQSTDNAGSTYTVSTIAGQNIAGNADGTGLTALLSSPSGVAVDAAGNVYVADASNNKIRKISPNGVVSTFAGQNTAGKKDGSSRIASFYYPSGVAVDTAGNVYVADKGNHKIRKITPDGTVTSFAGSGERNSVDGPPDKACFDKPVSLAVDAAGNVYVADAENNKIRKVTPNGQVTTLAGNGELGSKDGKGSVASFYTPSGIAVDAAGNVYVADYGNNRIRKITMDGTVSTIAGSDAIGNTDGNTSDASFFYPNALAVDNAGTIYIVDQVNHKIRKISAKGIVSTLAGSGTPGSTDGTGESASFNYPSGIAVDTYGNLYVADQLNCKIRKMIPSKKS
jgi:sugar lactone lactonase YvrE